MPTQPTPEIPPIPEMVGATNAAFHLGSGQTRTSLAIHAPTGPALLGMRRMPRRVFLKIENMKSETPAPSYDVYLNLPPDDEPEKHPELFAGRLPMFGLVETSESDERHPGNGLYSKLDVTHLYALLAASQNWDTKNLHVTFVSRRPDVAVDIQVGRVSLYFD
jgi:hypothetical protein